MPKSILIEFSITPFRLNDIITACRYNNVNYDFFSYYREEHKIDDMPENIVEKNHFTFATIPPLYNALKRDAIYYKNEVDFHKYNEAFIHSFCGNSFDAFEQEYIFKAINNKDIPFIPMLNYGSKIVPIDSIDKQHVFSEILFIKPNSAFKEFIGGVTVVGETFEEFLHRKKLGSSQNIEIMISPYKTIHSEYRFFVFNGNVITGSSYILEKEFNKKIAIPYSVQKEAERLATIFQPGQAFTLDLCLLNNGDITIVEYNHLSASGHYSCNLNELIHAITS